MKYGKLKILGLSKTVSGNRYFLCECDCGSEKVIRYDHLKSGATKSCGCIRKGKKRGVYKIVTHGMYKTRIFSIWCGLKNRCDNVNYRRYKDYGGRGITYDKRWKKFELFYEDMKEGYSDELTIDRIDNNGDYYKENCRWATNKEQQLNRRNNTFILFNGKNQTIKQWGEQLGIRANTISTRLHRGWGVKEALTKI